MYPLCHTCSINGQTICNHNDDERSLFGEWLTAELIEAIKVGYKVIKIYEVHHFETEEVKDSRGRVVLPAGIEVDADYEFTYTDGDTEVLDSDVTIEVTNKDYEIRIQDELRNIYVLKPIFLQTFLNDVEEIMEYPKKTTSYIGSRLKQGGSRPTDY